jgi:uncharacterized protein YndB with AHSA1/START domain
MNKEPIIMERTLNAAPPIVWRAITDKTEMKKWYFDISEFKAEVGFEFSFEGTNEGRTFVHLCKVTEVIPNKKLSYSWRYKDYPGISLLTFELFAQENKTLLKLTHEGLETFPQDPPDFARHNFVQGWTHILDKSLKSYLEPALAAN